MTDHLQVAIPLFPKFTALDAVGPYEVLQRIPTFDITFVGHQRGEVRTENGMLGLTADATFEELPDARRRSSSPAASAPGHSSTTSGCSSGCATPTPAPGSPRRSAPARWCSARPACSTA